MQRPQRLLRKEFEISNFYPMDLRWYFEIKFEIKKRVGGLFTTTPTDIFQWVWTEYAKGHAVI